MSTPLARAVARVGATAGMLLLALIAAVPATTAPAHAAGLNQWQCTKWVGNSSTAHRTCVMFTSKWENFDVDYRDATFNQTTNQTIPFTCQETKTTTWHESVTASAEAEAGVIFAKAKTTLSGTIAHESSTSRSSSSTLKIPPRKWGHCYRGMYIWGATGKVKLQGCSSQGCTRTIRKFRFTAPSTAAWKMGLGRPR